MSEAVLEQQAEHEAQHGVWVVVVDCGYSEWFEARDIRTYGKFDSAHDAQVWAADQALVVGREGGPVKAAAMFSIDPRLNEGRVVI